jgi:hypothetical protein
VPQIIIYKYVSYVTQIEIQIAISVFLFLPQNADTLVGEIVSHEKYWSSGSSLCCDPLVLSPFKTGEAGQVIQIC